MRLSSLARRAWRQPLSIGGGIFWVTATIALCWAIFGRPEWLG